MCAASRIQRLWLMNGVERRGLAHLGTKAAPLSDEAKRTLIRWIDLGCPVETTFDAKYRCFP